MKMPRLNADGRWVNVDLPVTFSEVKTDPEFFGGYGSLKSMKIYVGGELWAWMYQTGGGKWRKKGVGTMSTIGATFLDAETAEEARAEITKRLNGEYDYE